MLSTIGMAQNFGDFSYMSPKKYKIHDIKVESSHNIDHNVVIAVSGLKVGQEITVPGQQIASAINKLWEQDRFSDVQILSETIKGTSIVLIIKVEELERWSGKFKFKPNVSKNELDDIQEALGFYDNQRITQDNLKQVNKVVRGYFIEKGYFKAKAHSWLKADTLVGGYDIMVKLDKGERYKINAINIEGNEALSDGQIKRQMKDTKEKHWWKLFWRSKFITSNYEKDKKKIIAKYVDMSYRDAEIVSDTVYDFDEKTINIDIKINEGNKYYIRSINWVGNTKYRDGQLDTVLGIKPGDEYNQSVLDTRLYMNPSGSDVSSLYMDNGYLFFQINPVEKQVSNDSVDLEFQIYEGKQARIRTISVSGNTKTSDHVIIRDLYTQPGDLFSRDAVIRSQRELSQKGYFNPETLGVNPIPNPEDGTVDIEYVVEESPSDQIELSGGFGAGRIVGTLGVSFNNFALRRLFKGPWNPLPAGDGQKLSIRAQSNGYWFQSYNLSFTEPWLGGKKPQAFSFTAFHSVQSSQPIFQRDGNGNILRDADGKAIRTEDRQYLKISGVSVGLGKRLKWPDDYFQVYHQLSFEKYNVNNYGSVLSFSDGVANNLSYYFNISRNSIDQPLYPRTGAKVSFSFKTSAPYSWFDGVDNYDGLSDEKRFKWLEYNKIKFTTSWFAPLTKDKKLVANARFGVGLLNPWNKSKGVIPFERFYMGGSGLTGYNIGGREIIALRGYDDQIISDQNGDPLIAKYTLEMRYPLSLNPSATIYVLGFAEAGNSWQNYKDFNPLKVKRSAGLGVRIYLPMFGLMGLDYGFGFDPVDSNHGAAPGHNYDILNKGYHGQFHFTIGMNLGEL
ncbi:Outer membrane protein assembly factor BamA [Parvicella tangerina]|uniref:Outer membrane protein assembly factor BamA n=2 Tax=Parvicella tangerina TaxID=2829795 RepID=A0A916JL76_9FLAO|nr:Outer membrane protein assembly factor BamA [Parvicella tangerina]